MAYMKGQRKALYAWGVLACATMLCFTGKLAGSEFVTVIIAAFGVFCAANYGEHKEAANGRRAGTES